MEKIEFEERPNQNAKIAFIIWSPFDFYVQKNVIKHLPEAEFVVCAMRYGPAEEVAKYINDSIGVLRKNNCSWRVLSELRDGGAIRSFFERYEMVVAPRLWRPLAAFLHKWIINKKSVLINYGVGKDLITFAPWVARFNISLVEGKRVAEHQKHLTDARIVGAPKFDDWFNGEVNQSEVSKIKNGLDMQKKTVLYLPTHGSGSSLRRFGEAVLALRDNYNVLIKLHYLNRITEGDIVKKIEESDGVGVYDATDDTLPFFSVADVVVSDSSSATFEALLVDKPLVTLDTYTQSVAPTIIYNGFWHQQEFYSESIEQQIKIPGKEIGEVVFGPEALRGAVGKALLSAGSYVETRESLKKELFSHNDGRCGERASAVIRQFLSGEIEPKPSLLGAAIGAYLSARADDYQLIIKEKDNTIAELKKAAANPLKKFFK